MRLFWSSCLTVLVCVSSYAWSRHTTLNLYQTFWEFKFLEMRGKESLFVLHVWWVAFLDDSWRSTELSSTVFWSLLLKSLSLLQVPPEDTASPRTSFSIQDLRPYTEYVFSIRCMKEDGVGYWSDWSEEKTGITIEDRKYCIKVGHWLLKCECSAVWQWPPEMVYPCLSC